MSDFIVKGNTKYKTRDGGIIGPLVFQEETGLWGTDTNHGTSYYPTGRFFAGTLSNKDIVSEYVDAPAEVFVNYYPVKDVAGRGGDGGNDGVYVYQNEARAKRAFDTNGDQGARAVRYVRAN